MKPWQMMRGFGQPASGGATDPYWANVSSLLHFDGADGSTTFTDQTGKTWTAVGNAQIDTAQSKFGGASGLFDGSGDYLTTPGGDHFAFGTGDFTIEGWWRQSVSKAVSHLDFRGDGGDSSPRPMLYNTFSPVGTDLFYYVNGANRISAPSGTLVVGTFQHIAISRASGTTRMFVDGNQVGASYADATNYTSSGTMILGGNGATASRNYQGWIDEFRVSKGVARYTANFTPPSAPFPNS